MTRLTASTMTRRPLSSSPPFFAELLTQSFGELTESVGSFAQVGVFDFEFGNPLFE